MTSVRLLNPDFEYKFFDDQQVKQFVLEKFPQYHSVFESFRFPIQRYDLFRYLAIYHHGGFYFDVDVMLASGLSSLLQHGCVFPFEGLTLSGFLRERGMDWEIGNYGFGAAPGHPFIKAIIENCVRAQRDPDWVNPAMRGMPLFSRSEFFVLNSTGPGLVSRTLAERPELAQTVTVLFPEDVCNPASWNQFGNLGVHFMEASWRPGRGVVHKRLAQLSEAAHLRRRLNESRKLGKTRQYPPMSESNPGLSRTESRTGNEPLVSILIPAFNAEESIAETLRSAIAQTWPHTEVIVVDDGSSDRTVAIATQFESETVRVVKQQNRGAAAARNTAYSMCRGQYIQWLDADDMLAPDKIASQMKIVDPERSRELISSAWGRFMYRADRAEFMPTALWCDLSPAEWLVRKMRDNLYMQTATWLVSRQLAEAAGPWDVRLLGDDDGEYFCRVLLASDGVRFVPQAKAYYRGPGLAFKSLSYIGQSSRKLEALWLSMQLHIKYLLSVEPSERARAACLAYLQTCLIYFYPDRPEIVDQAKQLAAELGGELGDPRLSWKYTWLIGMFGWPAAKTGQRFLLTSRWALAKSWDKMLFRFENQKTLASSEVQ